MPELSESGRGIGLESAVRPEEEDRTQTRPWVTVSALWWPQSQVRNNNGKNSTAVAATPGFHFICLVRFSSWVLTVWCSAVQSVSAAPALAVVTLRLRAPGRPPLPAVGPVRGHLELERNDFLKTNDGSSLYRGLEINSFKIYFISQEREEKHN